MKQNLQLSSCANIPANLDQNGSQCLDVLLSNLLAILSSHMCLCIMEGRSRIIPRCSGVSRVDLWSRFPVIKPPDFGQCRPMERQKPTPATDLPVPLPLVLGRTNSENIQPKPTHDRLPGEGLPKRQQETFVMGARSDQRLGNSGSFK